MLLGEAYKIVSHVVQARLTLPDLEVESQCSISRIIKWLQNDAK